MRLAILFLFLGCTMASAQNVEKLRVGLSYGWALRETTTWHSISGEPSFRVSQKIYAGCRFELAIGTTPYLRSATTLIASYSLCGQYYFSSGNPKAFAGMGIGFYKPGVNGMPPYGFSTTHEETKLGVYPRVGFDYHHLTVLLEYNWVPDSNANLHDGSTGTSFSSPIVNSYASLKIGIQIWAGTKD
jgi:hypothetical protein